MTRRSACRLATLVLMAGCAAGASADERTEYQRRSAERDVALFQSLDRNSDGTVTKLEAHGDLNFSPRFDDMDINRDGIVTREELQRYIDQRYGVSTAAAGAAQR